MTHGKFYDYLFATNTINPDNMDNFIKKSHRIIKNAGLLLIFISKDQYSQIEKWNSLLEKHYYVATNTITIDNNWSVIISKKMHGWVDNIFGISLISNYALDFYQSSANTLK